VTVDLDLLADYTEGLLDPPDQARVESLVHTDREWASALDALRTALPSVATALASSDAEPIPTDVLTATLRALAAERERDAHPSAGPRSTRETTRPAAGRPPTVRKRRRPSPAVLAALGLLAVVAIGVGFLINTATDSNRVSGSAAPAAAPQIAAVGPVEIRTTGTDYTSTTLSSGFAADAPTSAVPGPHVGHSITPLTTRIPLAPGLDRLRPQPALDACLLQVETVLRGHATTVDYATYQGTPALIITVPDIDTVIAVGANCGVAGSGIDELARS
jgi:hypothetical protein